MNDKALDGKMTPFGRDVATIACALTGSVCGSLAFVCLVTAAVEIIFALGAGGSIRWG